MATITAPITLSGNVSFDVPDPPAQPPPTVGFPCIEDFGAVGWDPSTMAAAAAPDDGPAMVAALTWAFEQGVVLRARHAHYAVRTPVCVKQGAHKMTISSGARLPWGMDLSQATINSQCPAGTYTLDFKSQLMAARLLYLGGFNIYGGGGGGLCLRAREEASPTDGGAFVLPRIRDVNVTNAGGDGFTVWGEVFEGNFRDISARDCKGHGFLVKHGDSGVKGVPSSLIVDGFNFSMNGGNGAMVASPVSDVKFRNGDLISNWLEGIYMPNAVPSDLIDNCHFENNYMKYAKDSVDSIKEFTSPSVKYGQVRFGNSGTMRNCRMLDSLKGGARSMLTGYLVNPTVMDACRVEGTGNVLATVTGKTGVKFYLDKCSGPAGTCTGATRVIA